ncbi:DUF1622 domain-containing protein [Antarcticibacterium flavum]|uniref:DUF1622 domain-containing protein n=1 Tax=Antarcticibacterium flavum TaxID=2058175 RepID=A0A5B7X703_9FLAO|nr:MULTISPECIES: DUF1622 domain-containing protein [Antarcticibacterium]MCM4159624.1 hypothetical protein [Antarcticibacterium sp. W02-3]QCY70870.1 DUF1622 domain-containing protein [Antarcticibacterium flavum]
MSETFDLVVRTAATVIESIGILIIVVGALISLGRFLLKKQGTDYRSFQAIREELGRAILLGLEFLVAADIIMTVVYDATLERIINLGLIILIRTFLSFALEIEGKLPWKQSDHKTLGKK